MFHMFHRLESLFNKDAGPHDYYWILDIASLAQVCLILLFQKSSPCYNALRFLFFRQMKMSINFFCVLFACSCFFSSELNRCSSRNAYLYKHQFSVQWGTIKQPKQLRKITLKFYRQPQYFSGFVDSFRCIIYRGLGG